MVCIEICNCDDHRLLEWFVLLSQVKMDYSTGKSRGFGFVHFKDPEVEKIVLTQVHHIQGRTCEVTLPRSNYKASASVIFHVELQCSAH